MKEKSSKINASHLTTVPSPAEEMEHLFRSNYDLVFRTAYRVTGNLVDAEDVLQTVFLRLVRRREILDLSPSPSAYLHRAAINAALDIVRSRNNKVVPIDEIAPDTIRHLGLNPEAQHTDREMHRIIRQAIARLEGRSAEIFVLRYLEGYENKEIARMLGTSHLVVGVVLNRTRNRIRKEVMALMENRHEEK